MFQTLKLIPPKILSFDGEVLGILAFGVGGLMLFIVPFLDKPGKPRRKRVFTAIGVIVVLYIVALTIIGYLG
jgi:quinol-cytochrome oxidoreductase complex cytochrome b subunit